MTKITVVLASLFLLGTSHVCLASSPDLAAKYSPLEKQLGLSQAQVDKISTLRADTQTKLDQIDTSKLGKGVIIDMFKSGHWDEKAAKVQFDAIGGIQSQVGLLSTKYLFDVRQTLNKQQQDKLLEIINNQGLE